jgi:hypothetical protein
MRKFSVSVGVVVLLLVAGYIAYQIYFPMMVAKSITNEEVSFVPDNVKKRLKKIRKPVNEGAEVVVQTMYKSGVTMDQILKAIDNAKEEQALAMLDELNKTEIKNPDQVFSIAKKHFPVDFDVEIFRDAFSKKVSMRQIKKGIRYANIYKDREEFDAETAKSIAKRILLQKEDEFKRLTKID